MKLVNKCMQLGSCFLLAGDLLSSGVMYGKCEFDEWAQICEDCRINEADLLFLVFHYWLHKPLSITLECEMLNLYKIISAALRCYGYEGLCYLIVNKWEMNEEFIFVFVSQMHESIGKKFDTNWRTASALLLLSRPLLCAEQYAPISTITL